MPSTGEFARHRKRDPTTSQSWSRRGGTWTSSFPALRAEGIDYTAIELETLTQRLATRDLTSLTRVLTQPADRLSSLAVLRAPWCGLLLRDLLTVAAASDDRTILDSIADVDVVSRLSPDGRERVARLRAALAEAIAREAAYRWHSALGPHGSRWAGRCAATARWT